MAIDSNDKKWSIISLGFGAPSLGGSLGGGASISLDDEWILIGRYFSTHTLGDAPVTEIISVYVSTRSRMFTVRRGP